MLLSLPRLPAVRGDPGIKKLQGRSVQPFDLEEEKHIEYTNTDELKKKSV